jgi:hypothetical protein
MVKVKFQKMNDGNKATAISQMLSLSKTYNWPGNIWWANEESVKESLENDYNPDDNFYFYLNESNEVEVKIKNP